MPLKNIKLNNAKRNKDDEYYTLYKIIKNKLVHFHDQFEDKTLLFNCNDYDKNFWKYFYNNFDKIKPKKIIALGYEENAFAYEYDGHQIKKTKLNPFFGREAGDFQNPESIKYLQEADIVITNPPFSLFGKFIKQLIEFNKNFLIIGNMNASYYKNINNEILNKKCFVVPESNRNVELFSTPSNKLIEMQFCWFTNLNIPKHLYFNLILTEYYNPQKYLKYDNYNAINVDKIKDIPKDYFDLMGVPVTFILKWNPEQFELIDCIHDPLINGVRKYKRWVIRRINASKH